MADIAKLISEILPLFGESGRKFLEDMSSPALQAFWSEGDIFPLTLIALVYDIKDKTVPEFEEWTKEQADDKYCGRVEAAGPWLVWLVSALSKAESEVVREHVRHLALHLSSLYGH